MVNFDPISSFVCCTLVTEYNGNKVSISFEIRLDDPLEIFDLIV